MLASLYRAHTTRTAPTDPRGHASTSCSPVQTWPTGNANATPPSTSPKAPATTKPATTSSANGTPGNESCPGFAKPSTNSGYSSKPKSSISAAQYTTTSTQRSQPDGL